MQSRQFGEQKLDWSQVRLAERVDPETDEKIGTVIADPGNLTQYSGQVGQVLWIKVTGQNNGTVWGTDRYTCDSQLASAAVHAGAIKLNQTGIVKVTILPAHNNFNASSRNNISSYAFPSYPSSYSVTKVRQPDR